MENNFFSNSHIEDREIDELIGICRGMLADGEVNIIEAKFLLNWLNRNTANLNRYPFKLLHERLVDILLDNKIDSEEQLELIDLFMNITGEPVVVTKEKPSLGRRSSAPAMPFTTKKIPSIKNKVITLTGEFELGKRAEIVILLESYGAIFSKGLTKKTEFLIVGKIGSEHWRHSSFGRKIEKAMEYRDRGANIEVMGEEHLVIHFA